MFQVISISASSWLLLKNTHGRSPTDKRSGNRSLNPKHKQALITQNLLPFCVCVLVLLSAVVSDASQKGNCTNSFAKKGLHVLLRKKGQAETSVKEQRYGVQAP